MNPLQKAQHYDSGVFSNYKIKNDSGENPGGLVSQENMRFNPRDNNSNSNTLNPGLNLSGDQSNKKEIMKMIHSRLHDNKKSPSQKQALNNQGMPNISDNYLMSL